MKSVVLLSTSFPRSEPGSEAAGSFVVDLCNLLSEFCRVAIVAPGADNTVETYDTFHVYRYRTPDKPLSEMCWHHPLEIMRIVSVLNAGAKASRRATEDLDADILIALWALPCGFWARNAAKWARIPFVVWCLGSDIWSLGKVPIVKTVLKRVLSAADRVYADGYELAREVAALQDNRCEFLPSSRTLEVVERLPVRSKAPFRLVYIGRWHPNKGTDMMLEALSKLEAEDWRLIERIDIYGGGVLNDVVETEVDKLTATGRPVYLHGYVDKIQAIAAIQHSDWVLIPSRIESIPVIFSDAMKCHRPVICTPVGDLPELCNREQIGICASEVSPTALAIGVRQALHGSPEPFENGIRSYADMFDLRFVAQHLVTSLNQST